MTKSKTAEGEPGWLNIMFFINYFEMVLLRVATSRFIFSFQCILKDEKKEGICVRQELHSLSLSLSLGL